MEAIGCTHCGEPYPVFLFEFGIPFRCACGAHIGPPVKSAKPTRRSLRRPAPHPPRTVAETEEERRVSELRRRADRISYLIVATDFAAYEIEMEKRALKQWCRAYFPDRMDLYQRIFEARFRRLWEQFRSDRKK